MKYTLLAFAAMTGVSQAAGVLIDENSGNGGFVSVTTGFNATTEVTGWTSANGAWVDSGNSALTTSPFGTQALADSHFFQIHRDGGDTVTSGAVALTAGETVDFSVDYKIGGSGNEVTLSIDLVGTGGEGTINLGSIDTTGGPASFTQLDLNGALVANTGNYELVFNLPNAGGQGRDVHIDRVYLASAVPEPSSAALLGLGGVALILRRRK